MTPLGPVPLGASESELSGLWQAQLLSFLLHLCLQPFMWGFLASLTRRLFPSLCPLPNMGWISLSAAGWSLFSSVIWTYLFLCLFKGQSNMLTQCWLQTKLPVDLEEAGSERVGLLCSPWGQHSLLFALVHPC